MPERAVTPADCALLLAVPLTREAFLADCADVRKDFARGFARAVAAGASPETAWEIYAEHLGGLRESLRDVARAGSFTAWLRGDPGVAVHTQATLSLLRSLTSTHHVLTLFAHVRPSTIVAERDVLDPAEVLRRIRAAEEIVSEVVGAACPRLRELDAMTAGEQRRLIAAELTRLLRDGVSDDVHDALGVLPHAWSRVDLEEALLPAIAAAPMIELSDGLVPWPALLDAVPDSFDGVLDLTLCFSLPIAEALKRRRRQMLTLSNASTADLDFRIETYCGAIRVLRAGPRRYSDVMADLHVLLARALCAN